MGDQAWIKNETGPCINKSFFSTWVDDLVSILCLSLESLAEWGVLILKVFVKDVLEDGLLIYYPNK